MERLVIYLAVAIAYAAASMATSWMIGTGKGGKMIWVTAAPNLLLMLLLVVIALQEFYKNVLALL